MSTRRLVVALALAAATSLAGFAAPAFSSSDDWHNWHPNYQSAHDVVATYGTEQVADIAKEYGLPIPFTAKQYGAAKAERYIADLRSQYQLGPDFTSAQLAANAGAKYVAQTFSDYHVPTHFTEQEFKNARLVARLKDIVKNHPGLPYPFSSDDFIRVRGAEVALDLAQKYQLANAWVYTDLVAAAGPEEAARVRFEYHFGRNDTHDQIEHLMGAKSLAWTTDEENLPDTFTADQLLKLTPAFSPYSDLAKLPAVNDQSLIAYYGAQTVDWIVKEYSQSGLKATFTEADLRAAVAAQAIANKQESYDLDADFTSDALARAIGLSKVASVRHDYGLRPDFTAAEYQNAWEKHEADARKNPWYLSY